VHVDVRGLEPGREYWYRFTAGDWVSPVARTGTGPSPHDRLDGMAFAYATCQRWEEGFYNACAHMAEEDLDLVVFLGDYTYEYGIDPATGGVRGVELPPEYADETVTLDQFRLRHALYLRYVERVGAPGAPIETLASFVVEDGRPGAVPA
jgi:alkaline phosphatase D